MVPIPSSSLHTESRDIEEPLDDYSPVSALAITGLVLGLCSALALIHPVLWLIPLSAVLLACLALLKIAVASPPLLGRKAALLGLALALIFGISAPIQHWAHRRALRVDAMELADEWFTALRLNRPDYAVRLTRRPSSKASRAKPPMADPANQDGMLTEVRKAIHEQPMEVLLKLGKKAHVRLFQHEAVWWDESNEGVRDTYVVTVGKPSDAVSFFVRLGCLRSQDRASGEWQWQITKHELIAFPDPDVLGALE